ncbi:hypothetical protein [Nostoc sp.]|uniref:hypothetical protein n=1 Tax=Nostoc sp. TaxID=1180 RepID=UPI003593E027
MVISSKNYTHSASEAVSKYLLKGKSILFTTCIIITSFINDMEFLEELGILDTIKNASYLFLGLISGYCFWELCEHYTGIGISRINPIVFILALCWGASGFFFLPPLSFTANQLIYYALPDWDIPLSLWIKLGFLQHRSWLFSSVILPLALLIISRLSERYFARKQWFLSFIFHFIRDISIGLSVGSSAHLFGDFSLQWIPVGDTSINIFGWQKPVYFYIWLVVNLLLGLGIPFLAIASTQTVITADPNTTKV